MRATTEMLRAAQAATGCEPAECDECMSRAIQAAMDLANVKLTEARKAIEALDARGGGIHDHYIAADVRARAAEIVRELES